MRSLPLLVSLTVLLTASAAEQIPDTPAGRQFAAWQKANDSGDRATIQQFIDTQMPFGRVDQELAIHNQSGGGYDIKKIEESSDTRLVMLVQERGPAKRFFRFIFVVEAAEPHKVAGIRFGAAQPPPDLAPPKMTAAEAEAARKGAPFLQFSAWLDAFNSGDRAKLSQFREANFPSMNLDAQMNFRQRTGGFDLRTLEQASATTLTGLVQEKNSDQFARFTIIIEADDPHKITQLPIQGIPRPAEFPIARMNEPELVAALRAKLDRDTSADQFAGTVLIAKNGKVIFSGAYGLADREKKIPNKLDTRFRIGSMNKMFTATAVMQLVQAGKIKLTDPVGKYVKDYPNQDVAAKVTIHHLLTHTGGTGDFFGPEFNQHRLDLKTLDDYVALFGKRPPAFEPGSRWVYSNYGMVLLGVVIERVTGQSYYDYVAEHVYKPAGMTHSGSEPENEAVADRSIGYMRAPGPNGGWKPNTDTLGYRATSAGGGLSTVGDLMKFADALMSHKLLNAENTELLIKGKVDSGGGRMYAYGFEDERGKNGAGSVGHGGGAPGMNGDLRIYPASGYVVTVLSNLDPPAAGQIAGFINPRLSQ
jgi:CubicO group peptidase (beta-lactamase class C family)